MYVAFSAASNVTGILTDTVAVAELSHKYSAFSFWDYAAAGPYCNLDMNPTESNLGYVYLLNSCRSVTDRSTLYIIALNTEHARKQYGFFTVFIPSTFCLFF